MCIETNTKADSAHIRSVTTYKAHMHKHPSSKHQHIHSIQSTLYRQTDAQIQRNVITSLETVVLSTRIFHRNTKQQNIEPPFKKGGKTCTFQGCQQIHTHI